jgi:acyl transferase domain-containing protein
MTPGEADQAIAIVGLSCRLPGAADPRSFWRMLRGGASGITDVPADRWDASALLAEGIKRGGFLRDLDRFDPDFFGISPREAAGMDPQQRLMLELAWEALEDASIPPTTLRGAAVGVFLGAISDDYATLTRRRGLEAVTHLTMTGTYRAIIANRISYLLGLRGPSMTIDSAQSSALVSVQLACESLRRGDATLALAGGVSLALAAESAVSVARSGALSPDGECFVFDARASGYARGEGGGLVVLKPLEAAAADGDRIRCVILGGAINNDGGGDGLTVPSSAAQEEVLRRAWARARAAPSAIQYVELHGTGTRVGDPVEAAALGAALGTERPVGDPLLVGSAKTNVGHLEGAAGIVGLLKVALSIQHRELPASLNFTTAHPDIPLGELGLRVQTQTRPWPRPDRRLVAGVSSFGVGGTNCHLVLSEPPPAAPPAAEPGVAATALPWVISGRSPRALAAQAAALRDWLPGSGARPASIAAALVRSRAALEHRAVVVTGDSQLPGPALDALAAGGLPPGAFRGAATITGGCVFVFPGQGTQWAGMGAELLDTSAVFAARMAECEQAFAPFAQWPVTGLVRGAPGTPALDSDDLVQPALFAVMVSLAALWRSLGLEPAAVVGHSQGEIAAACVAGALSLPQAARIVALRSRLLAELSGHGGMASVPLPSDEAQRRLRPWAAELGVAAVNGPASTVVSGESAALAAFTARCQADGLEARRVPINYASHSPQMEVIRERLLADIDDITPRSAGIPFYSAVTGDRCDPAGLDSGYWYRNLRQPVRFDRAIGAVLRDGYRAFVEVGPHPILAGAVQEIAENAGPREVAVVGTLRRDQGGWARVLASAAELYVRGVPIDWTRLFTGPRTHQAELPAYAFQRRRYWLDTVPAPEPPPPARESAATGGAGSESALLSLIQAHAAAILGFGTADEVDPARAFKDLGFDSVTSVELRNRLAAATELRLPAALLYDYPTPRALARRLHAPAPAPATAPAELSAPDEGVPGNSIADQLSTATAEELFSLIDQLSGPP